MRFSIAGEPQSLRGDWLIAADGGSIDFTVDPGVVHFSLEVLPSALGAVSADLARVLAAPDASPDADAALNFSFGKGRQ